jgi:sortase (surface protein transpeptidase)
VTRPTWLTALGLAVAVAGAAGLLVSRASGAAAGPAPARVSIAEQRILTPSGSASASAAPPAQLIIPAIGVRTRLIRLSLRRSGALQVPDTTDVAGWFDDGPSPGQPGPAIIAGHVDSVKGPGVFFDLSQLRLGDQVYVRRSDGTMAVFTVTGVRVYLKSAFPTAVVYGPAPGDQLRLITCGGTFDYQDRSYLSNVVVFAVASTTEPQPGGRSPGAAARGPQPGGRTGNRG